jgi:Antitoxin Xre-like helix-turn-helix domain/Antitoxin Xre/MbcA/ParS C-terminal toxin-binding domain
MAKQALPETFETPTAIATKPEDRKDPAVRKRLSGPGMRAFFNVAKAWNLTNEEQRALLGWPSESAFYNYKAGKVPTLSFDLLTRISLVLGIYKALHILYPDFADRWVKLPNSNPVFGGRAAIETLAEGGIQALQEVRDLLDSRRGGWN